MICTQSLIDRDPILRTSFGAEVPTNGPFAGTSRAFATSGAFLKTMHFPKSNCTFRGNYRPFVVVVV